MNSRELLVCTDRVRFVLETACKDGKYGLEHHHDVADGCILHTNTHSRKTRTWNGGSQLWRKKSSS